MFTKISNNLSWNNIFKKFNILENINKDGFFILSADDIKSSDGKEARLMTKLDFKEQLPEIFKTNGLSILAIDNGIYKIAKNSPFLNVNKRYDSSKIIDIKPPTHLLTLNMDEINSEGKALDIAMCTDIRNILMKGTAFQTLRGRERIKADVSFSLNKTKYSIEGVQIEIDSGYETDDAIYLFEAKIGYKSTISIRQLLYPYLYWKSKIQNKKKLINYYFIYEYGLFRFIPYIYDGNNIGYLDFDNEKLFKFEERNLFNL